MSLQTIAQLVPTATALRVRLSVLNPSNRYEIFEWMTCSWEEVWRCDPKAVGFVIGPCAGNTNRTHILPPGQSFHAEERPLRILRSRTVPGSSFRVRFGLVRVRTDFTSAQIQRAHQNTFRSPKERREWEMGSDLGPPFRRPVEVIWSHPVTVAVRPEWTG